MGIDLDFGKKLQFGHGFDAVETLMAADGFVPDQDELQFGHGFDAVETRIRLSVFLCWLYCFNSATALMPWKRLRRAMLRQVRQRASIRPRL